MAVDRITIRKEKVDVFMSLFLLQKHVLFRIRIFFIHVGNFL